MTEKYLVFAGHAYYPKGGAPDLVGVYDDKSVAYCVLEKRLSYQDPNGWGHIIPLSALSDWYGRVDCDWVEENEC